MDETGRHIVCECLMLTQKQSKGDMTGWVERYTEKYVEKLLLI